ncbi:MAG: phosphoribosyltransferase [Spirochaetales bacterium]|nr:phosphoribosyltransferase [Spirochaetales bacterium]
METKSYDYGSRTGIREISWDDFGVLAMMLAETLSKEKVEVVVGIARAGLFPSTAVACMLRREMYPVRVTRRFDDEIVRREPEWKVNLPRDAVAGKVVAVIDEMADSGRTLVVVRDEVMKAGASRTVTASLFCHSWAEPKPDIVVVETDALVLLPWDYRVYRDGVWIVHPEYEAALRQQEEK